MGSWTAEDIPWSRFDPAALDPATLKVVKAAALVERAGDDYARFLGRVFRAHPDVLPLLAAWGEEEARHGLVLGRYAALADPGFDFPLRCRRFRDGYRVARERPGTVRGSLSGELVARCIVETGTSSLYSALADATAEPVLRAICRRIAGDEFRHYAMFRRLRRGLGRGERVPLPRLVVAAAGRIRELDDDELAFAWHVANDPPGAAYDRRRSARACAAGIFRHYRDRHVERAVAMILKAVGLDARGWLAAAARRFARRRLARLARAA
jgi:hypothetical protein